MQTALRTGPYDQGAQPAFDPERRHWQHTTSPVPLPVRPVRLKHRVDETRWLHKIVPREQIFSLRLERLINNCNIENRLFSIEWNNRTKRSESQRPIPWGFLILRSHFFSMKNNLNLRCSLDFSHRLNVDPLSLQSEDEASRKSYLQWQEHRESACTSL